MKIVDKTYVRFQGENGDSLSVRHSNRGEPFREGIEFSLKNDFTFSQTAVFLEDYEARELRDLLVKLYP